MAPPTYLEIVRYALGNVLSPFLPTVTMTVCFGNKVLINSCLLKAIDAENAPMVLIGGQPNELYTLVMFDPDSPNSNVPCSRQLVSWIVTNIPGRGSCAQVLYFYPGFLNIAHCLQEIMHMIGTEGASYVGPNPQFGFHRYILALYRQQAQLNDIEELTSRDCFNIEGFPNKHNLGNLVAVTYFNVRKQANRRNGCA